MCVYVCACVVCVCVCACVCVCVCVCLYEALRRERARWSECDLRGHCRRLLELVVDDGRDLRVTTVRQQGDAAHDGTPMGETRRPAAN